MGVVIHDDRELIGVEPVAAAYDEIPNLRLEVLTHAAESQIGK